MPIAHEANELNFSPPLLNRLDMFPSLTRPPTLLLALKLVSWHALALPTAVETANENQQPHNFFESTLPPRIALGMLGAGLLFKSYIKPHRAEKSGKYVFSKNHLFPIYNEIDKEELAGHIDWDNDEVREKVEEARAKGEYVLSAKVDPDSGEVKLDTTDDYRLITSLQRLQAKVDKKGKKPADKYMAEARKCEPMQMDVNADYNISQKTPIKETQETQENGESKS